MAEAAHSCRRWRPSAQRESVSWQASSQGAPFFLSEVTAAGRVGHTALSATEKADQRKIGKIERQRNAQPNENPLLAFSVAAKLRCLAFRPVGNSCHRPKVRMARSISSLIAKSDKPGEQKQNESQICRTVSPDSQVEEPDKDRKIRCSGKQKKAVPVPVPQLGGRISSPQVAQRPYHTSSRKMSCPRRNAFSRRECCRPLRQGYADAPYAARPSCG